MALKIQGVPPVAFRHCAAVSWRAARRPQVALLSLGAAALLAGACVRPAVGIGNLGAGDLREKLSGVVAPTLIVSGDHSIYPREATRDLCEVLADCEWVLLESVGHFPFVEVPEVFVRAVPHFLVENREG